jgi:hypothetical protein
VKKQIPSIIKPLILSTLAGLACHAAPISITDLKGRSIVVEIVGVSAETVKVRKADGTEADIPLASLSEGSREAVKIAPTAAAVPEGPAFGLKLTAVSNAIGKVTDKSWETSWGSYDKDVYRSRGVTITAEANKSGKAILEMHWIGSVAGSPSDRGVVIFSKKEITLAAREPQTHEFAALFVENDAKYVALGTRDRDGLKYAGWVARVITLEGQFLTAIAARPPLISMIDKPDPKAKEFPCAETDE